MKKLNYSCTLFDFDYDVFFSILYHSHACLYMQSNS